MSAQHPEGEGAQHAMEIALHSAGLTAQEVGYVNLHGTATPLNDQIESKVVHRLFGERVPSSSTKHLTGYTLGAAGVIEAAIAALILSDGLPLTLQDFSTAAQDDSRCSRCKSRLSPRIRLRLAAIRTSA